MNNKLLDAMEQIDDAYIQSAQNRLNGVNNTKQHRTVRRIILPLAAAVILLISTFTVAMAANQEFRSDVLAFFRIAEVENVPWLEAGTSNDPSVTLQTIGELVKAQYIRMDGEFHCGYTNNNLLYQYEYDEKLGDARPVRFWTLEDGQLVSVDIKMNRREISVDWEGATYRSIIDWFEWNGSIEVFDTSLNGSCGEDGLLVSTEVSVIPGRTDKVLLELAHGRQSGVYCYYMFYDLVTGQIEDFLAKTDLKNLEQDSGRLYDAIWNEDMSGAILNLCLENEVVTDYYLNMETWETTEIGALTGVTGATAVFADDNTLLLRQWGGSVWMPDSVTLWSYDLSTGVLTKTLNDVPIYNEFDKYPHGMILLGNHSPYCIVVNMSGKTQVVNQVTGTVTEVKNFTFSHNGDVLSSPDGTKLMYFVCDVDYNSRLQWSQLGVIDVEKGTFIAFDRNAVAIRDESIFWLDDNTVGVRNYSLEDDTVRGICLYEF